MKIIKFLKKLNISLIGSILFIPSPVNAEWIKLAENEIGIEYYFDPEYTSKKENLVIFQVLENHKVKTPGGYLSSYLYMQGDCEKFALKYSKGRFSKNLYDFDNPLGFWVENELLYVRNPEWKYPLYDAPWGKALKQACELKI